MHTAPNSPPKSSKPQSNNRKLILNPRSTILNYNNMSVVLLRLILCSIVETMRHASRSEPMMFLYATQKKLRSSTVSYDAGVRPMTSFSIN
ncbi:hypothetical protein HanIR_Chr12g0586331 [Helianthus annuus]|nr:hypothetical protein HanIR_Chr12g0586331 [Helianthus annuus]